MRGAVHRILCIPRKLLETCRLRVRFCPAGIGRRLQRGGKQQKRRLAKSLTGHDCRDRHNSIGADYAESVHNSGYIDHVLGKPAVLVVVKNKTPGQQVPEIAYLWDRTDMGPKRLDARLVHPILIAERSMLRDLEIFVNIPAEQLPFPRFYGIAGIRVSEAQKKERPLSRSG